MANFFTSKKNTKKNETSELTEQSVEQSSFPQDIKEKYFGKSLSFLSHEQKKLQAQADELAQKEAELQAKYDELLEKRKQASLEQQSALSDYNEASIDYYSKDLPKSLSLLSATDLESGDDELLDLLAQQKSVLSDMKSVENEKDVLCSELDKALLNTSEEIKTIRDQKEKAIKTQESISEAIKESGTETPTQPETDILKTSKKKKIKRAVANKVRGISFFNLSSLLKEDCETDYNVKKLVINYIIVFIVIALIGLLYSLQLPYVLILCLFYLVFGPSLIYFHHRKKYEKKKFSSAVRYVEQMVLSFGHSAKLLTALEETRLLMSGKLAKAIDHAITTIRHGKSNQDLYIEALKEIEAILPCARVKNLHEFLIDVERDGGECGSSLDIMLEDVREWDVRSNNFQQEQTVKGLSIIVSIIMSLGVCFFMTNILPDNMGGNISGFPLYQIVTTVSLIVMFFVYRFSARKLTSSWVNDDLGEDEARLNADYETIKRYAENPTGKIKPILAMTRMKTAMDRAFPRWVTRFALLASSKPIPVALSESVAKAPLVMKKELINLRENLESDPYSIRPYIEFFKDFDLPQVRSMMMMVYSLSSTDSSNVEKHILSIVKRNHLLQAVAEKIEYEQKMSMFTLFSTIPMLLACVIMMIDVGMIIINMLNTVM